MVSLGRQNNSQYVPSRDGNFAPTRPELPHPARILPAP